MRELMKEEMFNINGGTSFSGSMLNSIYKIIDIVYSIGESLGSFFRRIVENNMCDI